MRQATMARNGSSVSRVTINIHCPVSLANVGNEYGATMWSMTRPRGLTATAVLAALYDVVWYGVFHWTGHNSIPQTVVSTAGVALAFFLIWYYWRGCNWARIFLIWYSLLAVGDLVYWNDQDISKALLGIHVLIGAFFIWWLNTERVRTFFRPDPEPSKPPVASG